MNERWKPIAGYEERYEISDAGRIRTLSFKQRYLLRTGAAAYRNTKPRILSQQFINSGYRIAHLHLDNKRTAFLVHRLVALAFCEGYFPGADVNHISGVKSENAASNLEWLNRSANHNHAVDKGLLPHAQSVQCPTTGVSYPSLGRATQATGKTRKTLHKYFIKAPRNVAE